jgi:hypothetical protein
MTPLFSVLVAKPALLRRAGVYRVQTGELAFRNRLTRRGCFSMTH